MSQNHMTKKELKEDPFFEEVAHIVAFFRKHQTLLIVIIAVLVLALAGVFGTKAYIAKQNEKASGDFGIALDYYGKNQLVEAEDQFMLVAEQYKKSDWGKRSYYYLALVSKRLMNSEEVTLEYLETFVASDVKDNAMKASAYQLIGTYYNRNGDMLLAGKNYFSAAKKTLVKADKLQLGLRAGEAFLDASQSKKRDEVVSYLNTLDLNVNEKARVEALATR
jgi:hypothetical protein